MDYCVRLNLKQACCKHSQTGGRSLTLHFLVPFLGSKFILVKGMQGWKLQTVLGLLITVSTDAFSPSLLKLNAKLHLMKYREFSGRRADAKHAALRPSVRNLFATCPSRISLPTVKLEFDLIGFRRCAFV